ncbi:EsaB/YukD family protein, partial [Corynebacterium nasicanis]
MSIDHVLRLTTRFQIGAYQREADVALPAGSTLGEVIPEIVTLVGAPRISRPWLATTAAGVPLDPAVPLHQTSLDHGAVVVLTPRHEGALPVIRDAAEALAESGAEAGARDLAAA